MRSYDGKKCLVAPSSNFLFTMKIREGFIHRKDQIRVGSNVSKDCGHSLMFSLRGIEKKRRNVYAVRLLDESGTLHCKGLSCDHPLVLSP